MPPRRSSRVAVAAQAVLAAVIAVSVLVAVGRSDASDGEPTSLSGPRSTSAPDGLGRSTGTSRDGTGASSPRPSTSAPAITPVDGKVTWASGAYSGDSLAEHKEFGQWRGRKLDTALYFAPGETWDNLTNPAYYTAEYRKDTSVLSVISYPLWPVSEKGASLAKGAAGDYDRYWKALAERLVNQGLPIAVLRLGWEFNGTWYPWSARNAQGAKDYAAYFRRIVTTMRSVPGAKFTFSWCPVQSNSGIDLDLAYPGDDVVDDIGLDVYNVRLKPDATPAEQWELVKSVRYGLQWQIDFAREHGKKHSFPEWAGFEKPLDSRAAIGDDQLFVRNMFAWMVAHPPVYENYFDLDTDYGVYYGIHTTATLLPRSAEVYQRFWGS